jgi:hypothetical protein
MCCTCGADGHFQCGATCPNQPKPDGGAPVDQPGGPDGGAGGPPAVCAEGAACAPGTGCGGASTGGACLKCMCLADGTLHCTPCTSGGDDAGAADAGPVGPPAVCEPGAACAPGTGCGGAGAGGACIKCMCLADGHLMCSSCSSGGDADAGAPSPNPVLPPAQCVPGGACTAAQKCDNGMPPGAGCQKCFCGATATLMCSPC